MPKFARANSGRSITFWMRSARLAVDCACSDGGAALNRNPEQNAATSDKLRRVVNKISPPEKAAGACALICASESLAGMQIFKLDVQNWILMPVFVIEVPPLVFLNGEAFRFHCAAKQIAMPALQRSSARIVRERSRRHFVISSRHLDSLAGSEIIER